MKRSDIAVWIPLAGHSRRPQSRFLCLWVCEYKSELGELQVIKVTFKESEHKGWRRCVMRAEALLLLLLLTQRRHNQWTLHWNSASFYLTLQFIQQLLQLVDLRAPVLLILDAALWNHNQRIDNSPSSNMITVIPRLEPLVFGAYWEGCTLVRHKLKLVDSTF